MAANDRYISNIEKNFDLIEFIRKKLLPKSFTSVYDQNNGLRYIASETVQSNFDGIEIYPKIITGAKRDEVKGEIFKFIENYQEWKRYGAIELIMAIYGDDRIMAKNRAEALVEHNYEDKYEAEEDHEVFEIKTLDYAMFAKFLVDKYSYSFIEESLYVKENGIYKCVKDEDIEFIIMDNIYNSKISHRKEITKYIRKFAPRKETSHHKYILFNNGVYNIETGELEPTAEDMVFFNKVPVNYNSAAAKCEAVDRFFDGLSCNDEQIKTLLIQMIAYCLYRSNKLQKFFILQGAGGNGKSTLFELIKTLLGKDNTSDLELTSFTDKFGVGRIRNKLVNLGDDIDDIYIEKCATVKKCVTGEQISVEEKYQPKISISYYGKLIFSANNLPKMSDKTDGMKRRLVVVPMNADFKNGKANTDILDDITTKEALEYILMLAVEELRVILKNKSFIDSEAARIATDEYNQENNPIIIFLRDMNNYKIEKRPGKRLPAKYLFSLWNAYCIENNIPTKKPLSTFCNEIENVSSECGMGKVNIVRSRANISESEKFNGCNVRYRNNEYFIEGFYILEDAVRQIEMDAANLEGMNNRK